MTFNGYGVWAIYRFEMARALRTLWNRVGEVFEVPAAKRGARQEAVTSWRELTRDDPYVNILRGTISTFGAAVGGAENITEENMPEAHIRGDIKHHLDTHVAPGREALLFPAARGGHMNDRVFSREYFGQALKAIGREGIRVHDLRHFAGTQTARVGNLVETMERLGHSTVKASLIYQQVVSGRDAAVAEALSALASDSPKP